MSEVYIPDLSGVGGAERFKIGEEVTVSFYASLMRSERVIILGASLPVNGRICVRGKNGILGHYTPSMLEKE